MPYMGLLKQSTQVTKTVLMVDSTDHVTGKTGLTITKYLTKAGGTPASATMTTSELDSTNVKGIYSLVFSTSHTDTLGDFQLHLTATGADPVDLWWTVVARLNDDLAYPATSGRSMVVDAAGLVDANVVKLGPTGSGTAQTARDIGASVLLSSGTGTGQISLSSGAVLLQATQTGVTIPTVTSITNNVNAVLANSAHGGAAASMNLASGLTANITGNLSGSVGSVTGAVGSVTGAVGSVTGNVGGNVVGSVASVTNERGKYALGAVWIGPTANTNTTSYTDGIITNPVSTIAAAKTIADALGLRRFFTVRTGAMQIGADMVGYDFDGTMWSLTTTGGSRDVSSSSFNHALVIGGTYGSATGASYWDHCEFATGVSVSAVNMHDCTFAGTLTLNAAGNYDFVNCSSVVAGTSTPIFDCGSPSSTMNISFRRWSGGITFNNINSNCTISIDVVSGGSVVLNGADGNVQIRGMCAGITDNRTGTPTLGQNAVINITKINAEVVDALNVDTYAEPTGVPAATATLADKLGRLYQLVRNGLTVTATTKTFNDDSGSALWKKALSDNGTTYSEGEGETP